MLFQKKTARTMRRDLKSFRFHDHEPETRKIPLRLAVGMLAPFVLVTIFLVMFSKNTPLPFLGGDVVEKSVPTDIKETESVLPSPPPKQEPASSSNAAVAPAAPAASAVPAVPQPLTFFKTLKESEKTGSAEPTDLIGGKTASNVSPTPAKPIEQKGDDRPRTIQKKESQIAALPTSPLPAKPIVITPTPKGIGPYAIQLGSFPTEAEAAPLMSMLKGRGYDPYMIRVMIPDKGVWYRVRIGRYPQREEAEKAAAHLSPADMPFSFLITSDGAGPNTGGGLKPVVPIDPAGPSVPESPTPSNE